MAQTAAETLELLLEVGRLLSSKLDLGEVLKTVLEHSSRVVEAESASLLLLDEKTSELYFDVALGLGEEAGKVRLKMGQGIAGCVARDKKPEVINDVRSDSRWSPKMDQQSGFVTRSILAVPLTTHGRLIGVVEAINKKGGAFAESDLRTLAAFASQAAVAIENARLFSSLKEEKLKLDTVFAEMTDAAVLADEQGKVLLANGAARKLLNVAGEPSTLARALEGLAILPPLAEIVRSESPTVEFTATREKPKRLILAGLANRIRLEARAGAKTELRTGWLCVFRDETEERQKERLKRSFLSLISHKLKTPLASVIGYSEILADELQAGDPGLKKAAETISQQGRKLADLVDKLLRYTTLEAPENTLERAPVSLDGLVEEALKDMKAWLGERSATVEYKAAQGVTVIGDKNQLRDVVKNLIENAVKFDPKPEKRVSVWVEADEGQAALTVQDAGPGIPPEDQDKVFSMFHQIESSFTGQVEGWGLGLPFVKKVVEGHGGKVELRSKLGEGTTVCVRLPRVPGAKVGA